MSAFLDTSLCKDLRNAINATPIFCEDNDYKQHYSLICSVMDRLNSCVRYLNSHADTPKSEEVFLSFVMFACMIIDAVKEIFKCLKIDYKYGDPKEMSSYYYFRETCCNPPLNLTDRNCPTDDKFFEYFRSLAFAHPFETNRPKFLQVGEVHYSPWVLINNAVSSLIGMADGVGVRIYSNKFDDIISLRFSFSILKEYIRSRYELIKQVTSWAYNTKSTKESVWKGRKVKRSLSPIDILFDISDILETRFEQHSSIDMAMKYLSCEITLTENDDAISTFRDAIIETIPTICVYVDAMDYDGLEQALSKVIFARPSKMHSMAYYQLEKIYCYLNEGQGELNIQWDYYKLSSSQMNFPRTG